MSTPALKSETAMPMPEQGAATLNGIQPIDAAAAIVRLPITGNGSGITVLTIVGSISSLLIGIAILLAGMGLLGTLVGVRAGLEDFPGAVIGLIMSCYFLGYILGTYLCPALIRRAGHVRAFTAMAAIASVTAILHIMLIEPIAWALLRVITGACMVGMYMVIESWLNTLAPRAHRGRIFSIYVAITLLAMAVGQFLILVGDVAGFVPFGLVAMLLSLALVPVALTTVVEPRRVEAPRLSLRKLYRTSPLGVVGSFAAGLASSAFWGMGPVFGHSIELSSAGIAAFMSATILGGAVLQWPIGHLSDYVDRRRVLVGVCFAAAVLALIALATLTWLAQGLIVIAFLYGGVSFAVYSLSVAHLNDYLDPSDILDASRGLLLVFGAGAAIGPSAAGLIMDAFGAASLLAYFAAVLTMLGIFGIHRMRVRAPLPAEEQGEFVAMVRTSQAALEMDPRADS